MPTQNWINKLFVGSPGHDSLAAILGVDDPYSTSTGCMFRGNGADWGLKLANNIGSQFIGCTFTGGKERAVDIVRGSGIEFRSCRFDNGIDRPRTTTRYSPFKHCDLGVKGGAQVSLIDCVLDDILVGDYSIYDNPVACQPTRIQLSGRCTNRSGGPVIIRALNGEIISTEKACVITIPAPVWKLYYTYNRHCGDTRKGT